MYGKNLVQELKKFELPENRAFLRCQDCETIFNCDILDEESYDNKLILGQRDHKDDGKTQSITVTSLIKSFEEEEEYLDSRVIIDCPHCDSILDVESVYFDDNSDIIIESNRH